MAAKKKQPAPQKSEKGKALPTAKPSPADNVKDQPAAFHIVGVGASAGGLDALTAFFGAMPADCAMAFVVVQHLDPHHESLMKNLLAKKADLEVQDAEDGVAVKPNRVYLNPPGKDIVIRHGTLFLTPIKPSDGLQLPIDIFFSSLAEDQKEKAICVILSGAGSDGTLGAKLIQGEGGLVMVQDEKEAQFARMPQSVIKAGLADFILPARQMPQELLNYIRHPLLGIDKTEDRTDGQFQQDIQAVLSMVRTTTGYDFSRYKRSTIERRIQRRMALHQIQQLGDYRRYLRQNLAEIDNLFQDMTIKVTRFFRDPGAFEALKKKALEPMLQKKEEGATVRLWVPGCATGEEAYSIAIAALETAEGLEKFFEFKIFATDINADAIAAARRGYFPQSVAADVSTERLKQFFTKKEDHYHVDSKIRDMIVFALHDIGRDPPFTGLDIISCRNLLIYMNGNLQQDIQNIFRYALKIDGILFLGSSETTGKTEFFAAVDKKHKIYRKLTTEADHPVPFHLPATFVAREKYPELERQPGTRTQVELNPGRRNVRGIVEETILNKYAFPAVLIDAQADILYFHGNTAKFLAPPVGEPSFNIFKMVSGELHFRLAKAFEKVKLTGKPELLENIQVRHNDGFLKLDVNLTSLDSGGRRQNWILIEFKEAPAADPARMKGAAAGEDTSPELIALEEKLRLSRQELQAVIEELETSNEELKSANEELQANNEELQSTNEELESSKEELQSTNEELETVNAELSKKNQDLLKVEEDLKNLFTTIDIGILYLDVDLRIKRFTQATTEVFNLKPVDIGRKISDITGNLAQEPLTKDVEEVLDTLTRKEIRIQGKDSNIYAVRIAPYRTQANMIEGVVITFLDVTFMEDAQVKYRDALSYFEKTTAALYEPILILEQDFTVTLANPAFYRMFKTSAKETLGQCVFGLGNDQWDIPELRRFLEDIIPDNTQFTDWHLTHDFPRIGHRKISVNGCRIAAGERRLAMILLSFQDITPRDVG